MIFNQFNFNCRDEDFRLIPRLGSFAEQTSPVVPTPHHRGKKKGWLLMGFELGATQQVPLSIVIKDKKLNPAKVDGPPQWSVDNSELLSVAVADDGMSCVVAAAGPLGTGMVTVTADADLGPGVETLIGSFEVTVTAGKATQITVTPGQPVEQA